MCIELFIVLSRRLSLLKEKVIWFNSLLLSALFSASATLAALAPSVIMNADTMLCMCNTPMTCCLCFVAVGTMGRMTDWKELLPIEQKKNSRFIALRNKKRKAKLQQIRDTHGVPVGEGSVVQIGDQGECANGGGRGYLRFVEIGVKHACLDLLSIDSS